MADAFRVVIREGGRQVYGEEFAVAVELGREEPGDGEIYKGRHKEGIVRIPLAGRHETSVSQKQLLIEPLSGERVRLTNRSNKVPIRVEEGKGSAAIVGELRPTAVQEVLLPVNLGVGPREVWLEASRPDVDSAQLQSLSAPAPRPGIRTPDHSLLQTIAAERMVEGPTLIPWLQAIMDVHGAEALQDVYDRAAGALLDLLVLDRAGVLLGDGSEWEFKAFRSSPRLSAEAGTGPRWKPSKRVLRMLREEKRTVWQPPPAHSESISGIQAMVAAPILDRQGEVIGALYGDRSWGGGPLAWRPVTQVQAMLVQLLAGSVADAQARRKLLQVERDLEIGREIQAGFLPRELPSTAGWELALHFQPARMVGGDFYDAFELPSGHLALVIADVCDKGVGASLFMALTRSLLRASAEQEPFEASEGPRDAPAETPDSGITEATGSLAAERIARSAVERTHRYIYQTHGWQCMFCTVFFGVLDPASGELTYINAGHDSPVLVGGGVVKGRLQPTGPAVGFAPRARFGVARAVLDPGDILFAFTDGVTDARDPAGRFFTDARLLALLGRVFPTAAELVQAVTGELESHIAGADPFDDITILAARRSG